MLATALVTRAELQLTAPGGLPHGKTVSAQKLWEEFDRSLPPGVWISPLQNEEYLIISAQWLRRSFLPALNRQMDQFARQKIGAENSAANCNGFALLARLMLNLSAMATNAPAPATATMIVHQAAPFGGLSATQENHSVAFVLTDEGPWIIEVQSGEHVKLADYPNRSTIKMVSVH